MAVILGSVTLENVLTWEEEESDTIPIKRIIRKSTPTTQSKYYVRTPRVITISVRANVTEKANIRNLKNQFLWQQLMDYDGITLVDYVWIQDVKSRWRGDIDKDYPWQVDIVLICSMT